METGAKGKRWYQMDLLARLVGKSITNFYAVLQSDCFPINAGQKV